MPTVGKKKFDYTTKGKKAAKSYAAKTGKKVAKTKRSMKKGKWWQQKKLLWKDTVSINKRTGYDFKAP